MQGDFSRWTFDRTKRYSRVLSLQGRVLLDADFNEAFETQIHELRSLAVGLIGEHAGRGTAFEIAATTPAAADFVIRGGWYYVNGIPCRNIADIKYSEQPSLLEPVELKDGMFLAYLDVWEQFVTYIEDRDPAEIQQSIREVALGGPDTSARTAVMWKVGLTPMPEATTGDSGRFKNDYAAFLKHLTDRGVLSVRSGMLKARARKPKGDDLPCAVAPESKYRGPENQLYRVEIHRSGDLPANDGQEAATFKWSRENASVIFPIRSIENTMVTVDSLGRDERFGLKPGDLVEVIDDDYILQDRVEPLLKVASIDIENMVVELNQAPASTVGTEIDKHPILRRWEGTANIALNPDTESEGYLHLEDGVEVRFSNGAYRARDYWMIPARTASGDVEWPGPQDNPSEIEPHGVRHYYAPLAVLQVTGGQGVSNIVSLRRVINQLWS